MIEKDTQAQSAARAVLHACLAGDRWQESDVHLLADDPSGALFAIVAEGLADRFDAHLNKCYVDIFSFALSLVTGLSQSMLRTRYERIRHGFCQTTDPGTVVLLSRVTIGADIVITSTIARALRHRFLRAELYLAGSTMAADLLGLPCIPITYPSEGTLEQRVSKMNCLRDLPRKALIVDPDSRMTQLGLLPITTEDRYCFFESRAEGVGGLAARTRAWCERVWDVSVEGPLIFPEALGAPLERPAITMSLGVGGNDAKRLDSSFEREMVRGLSRYATVIVDKGQNGEESERVARATAGIRNVRLHEGTFPAWAGVIAQSDLYIGYDSAGQHAAAALRVPMISLFAGAVCNRFFQRWRPSGQGVIYVICCDGQRQETILIHTLTTAARLLQARA